MVYSVNNRKQENKVKCIAFEYIVATHFSIITFPDIAVAPAYAELKKQSVKKWTRLSRSVNTNHYLFQFQRRNRCTAGRKTSREKRTRLCVKRNSAIWRWQTQRTHAASALGVRPRKMAANRKHRKIAPNVKVKRLPALTLYAVCEMDKNCVSDFGRSLLAHTQ